MSIAKRLGRPNGRGGDDGAGDRRRRHGIRCIGDGPRSLRRSDVSGVDTSMDDIVAVRGARFPVGVTFDRSYDQIEAQRGASSLTLAGTDVSYDQIERLARTGSKPRAVAADSQTERSTPAAVSGTSPDPYGPRPSSLARLCRRRKPVSQARSRTSATGRRLLADRRQGPEACHSALTSSKAAALAAESAIVGRRNSFPDR